MHQRPNCPCCQNKIANTTIKLSWRSLSFSSSGNHPAVYRSAHHLNAKDDVAKEMTLVGDINAARIFIFLDFAYIVQDDTSGQEILVDLGVVRADGRNEIEHVNRVLQELS
jgi:hypothetical protein